jgi:hypothetical protein
VKIKETLIVKMCVSNGAKSNETAILYVRVRVPPTAGENKNYFKKKTEKLIILCPGTRNCSPDTYNPEETGLPGLPTS